MVIKQPRQFLRRLFDTAVAAADPSVCVPPNLPAPPKGRTVVIGAGKAAAVMAKATEDNWPGPLTGLVVTRYGHSIPCERIKVVEAAHPVPDRFGVQAAKAILKLVNDLGPEDLVICLLSGGGSALLTLPAPGISLSDKKAINRSLLKSGATISEMNCVRKHVSAIKGGRLAVATSPAKIVNLMISDVPGDDPAAIASGPTVPDPTSIRDARAILRKFGITAPISIENHLSRCEHETPKPGDRLLRDVETVIVASPQQCLEDAAEFATSAGVTPKILSDKIEGESRDVALVHAAIAHQVAVRGQPFSAPVVLLSGGETTVSVRGNGRGGPNAEFQLALAQALKAHPGIYAVAGDTDGIDGTEDNAGAFIDPTTLRRAEKSGMDAGAYLDANDGYSFFSDIEDLLITGPTMTNVNDFRAILIDPANERPSAP